MLLQTLPGPLVFWPVFDTPTVLGLVHEAQTIGGCACCTGDTLPYIVADEPRMVPFSEGEAMATPAGGAASAGRYR